jgi:hypothetical protein
MDLQEWLLRQLDAPGALGGFLTMLAVTFGILLAVRLARADRRHRGEATLREAQALAGIADHVCDLVVEVSDALRDEVNAHDFLDRFDRRQFIDAAEMLNYVPGSVLPSLALLRPLFDLRGALDRATEVADWIGEAMQDPERDGWREVAAEMSTLARRAAVAADAFRRVAQEARRL